MTLDINHLEQLLQTAVPGPWRYVKKDERKNQSFICMEEIVAEYSPDRPLVTVMGTAWRPLRHKSIAPTARLIVAAINALPELIAEVKRLRADCRTKTGTVRGG